MSPLDETRALLGDLIAFPTVSSETNLDLIAYVTDYLEPLGARVEVWHNDTGSKANLFATLGPEGDGGIVLSGHSDVVPVIDQPWSSDPFLMEERDGKLYGRGTCDMKGFIAAAMVMARAVAGQELTRPLHLAFTYDEEVGCLGGQALVADLVASGLKPSVAIIGEPTEMRVISGHKGVREVCTHFEGLAGHGSDPDAGVSAVEYAARYVNWLLEMREELKARAPEGSAFEPPWSSLNVGSFNGGSAANVIAGTAEVEWDFRAVQDSDTAFIEAREAAYINDVLLPAMRSVYPEASVESVIKGDVAGLMPVEESEAVRILSELAGTNAAGVVAFGTEAGLFQAAGISAVVCGPGSIAQAHKADEFVEVAQLEACLKMLDALGRKHIGAGLVG